MGLPWDCGKFEGEGADWGAFEATSRSAFPNGAVWRQLPRGMSGDGPVAPAPWADVFSGIPDEETVQFKRLCRFCEQHQGQVLATLPWLASEVAGRLGFAAMLSLVRREGGTRLYVSRDYASFAADGRVCLDEAAHQWLLGQTNASGCVEIPSGWGVFLALRRVGIAAALEAGHSQRAVASAFGVTERSLRGRSAARRLLRNRSA